MSRFLVMKFQIVLLLLCSALTVDAQLESDQLKADMAFYGDALMNLASSDHRQRANEKLIKSVDAFLSLPNSFEDDLSDVPWLSIVQDDSSTFRVITWQVNKEDSIFTYEGRIQFESGQTIRLMDDKNLAEPLYATTTAENWYGARYSKMKKFLIGDQIAYLLFGFNAHSKWNRQKVVDVLLFENDQPHFGKPVFTTEGKSADRYGTSRLILTYSLDIRVNLDYDESMNMIVFDHLIPMQGRFPGQGQTYVSDGSFESYSQDAEGIWIHQEKLFNEVLAEPLDDGRDRSKDQKKDLFGRVRQ